MSAELAITVLRSVYATVLRDLLVKAVEDTATPWDDRLIGVCDAALQYRPVEIKIGGGHAS